MTLIENFIISWNWHIKLFKHLNYFIFKGFGSYGIYNILSINFKKFWWLLTIKLMKSLKIKKIRLIWFLFKNSKFSLEFTAMLKLFLFSVAWKFINFTYNSWCNLQLVVFYQCTQMDEAVLKKLKQFHGTKPTGDIIFYLFY